ncbi:hypothetical protein DSM25558_2897 [Agrobacterium sp. DSM 25558]|nr:hypothetical protein DSM25558_2897 [Agrobacterium sp. DSM 25558]
MLTWRKGANDDSRSQGLKTYDFHSIGLDVSYQPADGQPLTNFFPPDSGEDSRAPAFEVLSCSKVAGNTLFSGCLGPARLALAVLQT